MESKELANVPAEPIPAMLSIAESRPAKQGEMIADRTA
jgi:hypothetical protein